MRSLLRIRSAVLEIWILISIDHKDFYLQRISQLNTTADIFQTVSEKVTLLLIFKCVTGIVVVAIKNDHSSITHFTCKQMVIVRVFIMSRWRKHQSQLILTVQLFFVKFLEYCRFKNKKFWVLINFSFEIFVPVTMFVNRTQSL